jgi:hypothetical protein
MTNYVNEEEDDKYSSEEKISDDTPQVEVEVDSTEDNDWGTDEEDDDWEKEEVEVEGDEIPDTVEDPTDDGEDREEDEYEGSDEIPDSIKEPSTAEINSEPSDEQPKGFKVLSFEDFISNK